MVKVKEICTQTNFKLPKKQYFCRRERNTEGKWGNETLSVERNIVWQRFEPFPKQKEFADKNFNLDENGGKFSKRVENNMGKGEIACNSWSFRKTCTADM